MNLRPSRTLLAIATLLTGAAIAPAQVFRQAPQRYYTPRYVYAPGYYGTTYYYYVVPAPAVAAPPAQPLYHATPRQASGEHYVGPMHPRDWSSGRYSPLAKPWLRPMD